MRHLPLAVPVLSLVLAGVALGATNPAAPSTADEAAMLGRLYGEALAHGQAYDNLRTLVAEHPGRLAGSDSLNGAIAWGVATLTDLGLDRVYIQPCMVPHWVRGAPESVTIQGDPEPLAALALGGSVATPTDGVTAEVIELHSLKELAVLGTAKLAGKIVFFNRPMDPTLINPGRAYGIAGDQRNHGPGAASKYGVAAVLTRSLTEAHDDIPHTGTSSFAANEHRIPCAALSTMASDRLSAALAKDPHTKVTVAIHSEWLPDAPSSNVIGEIKGSEFPNQIILVGGHLDSWDIAPGAHDDGSGVVQSIEVLRLFKALGIKPRHTIRCVLFVNEENGSRGSAAYAAAAQASTDRHILAIETDNGGFQPKGFRIGNPAHTVAAKAARWLPLFQPYGIYDISEGSGGADVEPLLVLGVPAGELTPDSQRYFDYHHTRIDSIDKVNPRELHLGAASLAALIWLVDAEGL